MATAARYVSIRVGSATSWSAIKDSSAIATSIDVSIAVMVMAGVGAGDGGAVTVGGSSISDFIFPEWIYGESAGFTELTRHIILNCHSFIKRAGAPFRFQFDLL
jgi:hypothetical protein